MSRVLLDTNVLSELVRPKPDSQIQAFVRSQTDPLISALTIHEIAFGADRAPDPARRAKLSAWLTAIKAQFATRIVDVDVDVAEHAGRLRAAAAAQGANADPIDALIAACAAARGAAVATRNVRDFVGFGVMVIDPGRRRRAGRWGRQADLRARWAGLRAQRLASAAKPELMRLAGLLEAPEPARLGDVHGIVTKDPSSPSHREFWAVARRPSFAAGLHGRPCCSLCPSTGP